STVRPQGARAKARSSPPARFTLPLEQGTLQQQQNKKPLTQISLQNRRCHSGKIEDFSFKSVKKCQKVSTVPVEHALTA
ncbi:MAG TPA: hypothetical protein VGY98_17695, partial [Verrucomicrobiae bacterium]|nr:hypothetical protein [Verrucomicrobiae bacterium]